MNAWGTTIALMGPNAVTLLVVITVYAQKDLKEMEKNMEQDAVPNLASIQGKKSYS